MLDSQQSYSPSIGSMYRVNKKNTDLHKLSPEKPRSTSTSAKRSFVQQFRMRVVDNNIRGKNVDKITADLMKPTYGNLKSTYSNDFQLLKRPVTTSADEKNINVDTTKNINNLKETSNSQAKSQNQNSEK